MMDQILGSTTEAAKLLAAQIGPPLLIASVTWAMIRVSLSWLDHAGIKWAISLLGSVGFVVWAHGSDVMSFGPGPAGWNKAYFYGAFCGMLAPTAHELIIKRFWPGLAGNGKKKGAP